MENISQYSLQNIDEELQEDKDIVLEFLKNDISRIRYETGEVSEEEKQSFKEKFAEGYNKTKYSVSNLFSKFGNNKDKIKTDPIEEIKKYKELLDSGIINQEEFDKKKKELLNL